MGASLVIATVILAPFAAADLPSADADGGRLGAVAALGVFCTAMAFVVFTVLVREAGTGRATIITYVNPLVAVVLGVTLLGERPGPGALAGLVLILAGSWLSTQGGRRPGGPWRRRRRRGDDGDASPVSRPHGAADGGVAGARTGKSTADRLLD